MITIVIVGRLMYNGEDFVCIANGMNAYSPIACLCYIVCFFTKANLLKACISVVDGERSGNASGPIYQDFLPNKVVEILYI